MSQRGLEALLRPKSIAVIGASDKVGRNHNDEKLTQWWV